MPDLVAVIPARYASSRFPGKPLARLGGLPMVQHVHDRCRESGVFARIVVATDDARIAEAAQAFGAEVAMTSPSCESGTDRVAEVARALPDGTVVVNVQGDEPLLPGTALRTLTEAFAHGPEVTFATLVRPLREEERQNPNVVKAVLAHAPPGTPRRALYFSRQDLPYLRDPAEPAPERWAHLGVYGYRKETLLRLAALPPSPLERCEKLEQLRALEAGILLHCLATEFVGMGVDTPEDLVRAGEEWARRR